MLTSWITVRTLIHVADTILSVSVCQSVCLFVCLSVCLFVCLSVCLPHRISVHKQTIALNLVESPFIIIIIIIIYSEEAYLPRSDNCQRTGLCSFYLTKSQNISREHIYPARIIHLYLVLCLC